MTGCLSRNDICRKHVSGFYSWICRLLVYPEYRCKKKNLGTRAVFTLHCRHAFFANIRTLMHAEDRDQRLARSMREVIRRSRRTVEQLKCRTAIRKGKTRTPKPIRTSRVQARETKAARVRKAKAAAAAARAAAVPRAAASADVRSWSKRPGVAFRCRAVPFTSPVSLKVRCRNDALISCRNFPQTHRLHTPPSALSGRRLWIAVAAIAACPVAALI